MGKPEDFDRITIRGTEDPGPGSAGGPGSRFVLMSAPNDGGDA